ncbi:phospholipase D family protein [uncultured Thiodictyon sp.]|uniref:phospholipase D family protein n=1 Tax=uncultured Thiodictyon sp. TaxID=1846217 RepID=UPI0025E0E3F4|nr:phospholipase D family protein [uncultured Thiodictyon sp.]
MGLDSTDSLAVLDALTPPFEWITDLALLSTYSVDLVAAAAIVVALAGEGDDHERLKQGQLARACERMRDRFRIICQAGRIAIPRAGSTALVLADRWVREVNNDGNERSWHAKIALVRYILRDPYVPPTFFWRLWVGSRNLTRDTSWDSALVAVGHPTGKATSVGKAIADAGRVLASRAALPGWSSERVHKELQSLRWQWPDDVMEVRSFSLWPDAGRAQGFPKPPAKLRRVVAVSPFVDGTSAARLGAWGSANTQRQLLTIPGTMATLAPQTVKPLAGFTSLHQLDPPTVPEGVEADHDDTEEDQMIEVHRGLHAKLIWAETLSGDHLWLGSSNLTERAWDGRNTEAVLHLLVKPCVGKGLCEGLVEGLASEVLASELPTSAPEEDAEEVRLDRLRNRIAGAWTAVLHLRPDGSGFVLRSAAPPLLAEDRAGLTVCILGSHDQRDWVVSATEVCLPAVPLHQQTELIELTLSTKSPTSQSVAWLARAPLDPAPDIGRDRAVLARLMGPRAFLAWLQALLNEIAGDSGDRPWPPDNKNGASSSDPRPFDSTLLFPAPTLEAVLRAWTRDPSSVRHVDRAITTWAEGIRLNVTDDADEYERDALGELQRFEEAWRVIRVGLSLDRETA